MKIIEFNSVSILEDEKVLDFFLKLWDKNIDELYNLPGNFFNNSCYSIKIIPNKAFLVTCLLERELSEGKFTGIVGLVVDKEYKGGGLGRKLVETIKEYPILVCTKNATDFYRKCGFSDFGDIVDSDGKWIKLLRKDLRF